MQNIIYFVAVIILTSGLFIMLASDNYVRKMIGLGIFQSSVLIFYIALGKVSNGIVPIDRCGSSLSNECAYINTSNIVVPDTREDLQQKYAGYKVSSQRRLGSRKLTVSLIDFLLDPSLRGNDIGERRNDNLLPIPEVPRVYYSSPLPHVLMLTAIVVGFATLSVGLALIYRIFKQFGTILESEVE